MMRRHFRWLAIGLLVVSANPALAQDNATSRPVGRMSVHDFAAKWMMQQDDLADTAFYREDNARLIAESNPGSRIVLAGDSITFRWKDVPDLPGRTIINRGIAGQNSSQMLLRFEDDVVALRPAAVVLMIGTNDLRVYAGTNQAAAPEILARIRRNITAMADIADANDIAIVLTEIPPFAPERDNGARDPETWRAANAWLRQFAGARGYQVIDYAPLLADGSGAIRPEFTEDGLHPNATAYRGMTALLADRLAALLD